MKRKRVCYEINCNKPPLGRVGINMLKVLGIQPGTENFEKQKHLIAVNLCRAHFLERFPNYHEFKKAYHLGILMVSRYQFVKLSQELYDVSMGKEKIADFRATPKT